MKDAVVVAYGRSGVARANKGSLRNVHPVDYGGEVLRQVVERVPELDREVIHDVVVGCAKPEGVQGFNMGKLIALRAELPYNACGQTVNRFCASGLQAIAIGADMIRTGQCRAVAAGGVEKMTGVPMGAKEEIRDPWIFAHEPGGYMPMGLTAENVADRFNISREDMDRFALESQRKAAAAQSAGKFKDEIISVGAIDDEGKRFAFQVDEGVRANATLEKLQLLEPVFSESGRVTAGNASQMSDGAGFVILMDGTEAEKQGIRPVARFIGYTVAGVDPQYMGIGPIAAVPRLMRQCGLSIDQMDVIELNEAFAAQALPCIRELGLNPDKVNPNGGAIALGHPLGATGAVLTCKALAELERVNGRYALVTMCIGGGMGAAGIYERIS